MVFERLSNYAKSLVDRIGETFAKDKVFTYYICSESSGHYVTIPLREAYRLGYVSKEVFTGRFPCPQVERY